MADMDDVTITDARREMPTMLRRIQSDPGNVSFGITVNGRRAAILESPVRPTVASSGWLDSQGLTRPQLPDAVQGLLDDDNRGTVDLWIHVQTGAFVVLVPQGNWDEVGRPAAFYVPSDRSNKVELNWMLGQWDGTNPAVYDDVLDAARRYVNRRLGSL